MMAMALAVALASGVDDRRSYCRSLRTVGEATAIAHLNRQPRSRLLAAVKELKSPTARADALDVIRMAYEGNADDGVTPREFGAIVYGVCMVDDK